MLALANWNNDWATTGNGRLKGCTAAIQPTTPIASGELHHVRYDPLTMSAMVRGAIVRWCAKGAKVPRAALWLRC